LDIRVIKPEVWSLEIVQRCWDIHINRGRGEERRGEERRGECKGNLTNLRRILHLSLAKGNPK
jgi:hypothetical protein